MKKCKKFLCMAVLALAMTLLMGTTALAATKTITLKSGKVYNQTVQKYGDTYYYKITVPKTGYLTVKGYAYSKYKANTNYSMRMTLCNSKKKPVDSSYGTGSSENRGYKVYYGVKKGTYYLKVTDGAPYKLSYSFKAVTEKSGSKKSKAVALKKNKAAGGLQIAGESASKADWYKIVLPKKQKVTLTYSTKANNTIWFKIIPASKNVYLSGSLEYCMWDQTKTVTTKDKLPAGTYYVQVYKYNGADWMSGYYTLKWK